ncbi:MAG: hypothetical protein QOF10_6721, partial [Kribbellaceae bacterium]|nr:hypothetical protein [Kribbellaceae bacterium]
GAPRDNLLDAGEDAGRAEHLEGQTGPQEQPGQGDGPERDER